MRTSRLAAAAFVMVMAFTLLVGVAMAHHGRAGYADKVSTVTGVVRTVEWKNPHVYINFNVKDQSGKVLTMTAQDIDSDTGKTRPIKFIYTIDGNDHHVMRVYEVIQGKETLTLEVDYKKTK